MIRAWVQKGLGDNEEQTAGNSLDLLKNKVANPFKEAQKTEANRSKGTGASETAEQAARKGQEHLRATHSPDGLER